ncbi:MULTISPECIES: DUF4850 domain-containing protein [unclassified Moraxella]|uniref:DUF4850 domain-containing protein n=1 Tax=unclassified Moraxella TaxID=2685852 RepID=UPI003AF8FAB6
MIKKTMFAIALSLFVITSHAETHQFSLNLHKETIEMGKKLPKPKSLGQLKLVNGSIPAYQVYFVDGISDKDYETIAPQALEVDKSLDKNLQNQLVAYSFDGRWIVLPKNWQFIQAGVGADGSRAIAFAPPTGQNGHFTYWTNNGSCYGCGLWGASLFFKEADKLAQKEYDSQPHFRDSKPAFTSTQIRPHTQAYRTTINGQNIDGLAYFNNDGDVYTELVEVSLPKNQSHLATPILNWWIK